MKKIVTLMIGTIAFLTSPAFAMDEDQGMEHKGIEPTRAATVPSPVSIWPEEAKEELLQSMLEHRTFLLSTMPTSQVRMIGQKFYPELGRGPTYR